MKEIMLIQESADAEGLFAEVDEEAQAVAALLEIEEALLDILGEDGGVRFGLEDQLGGASGDEKVYLFAW